MDTLQEPSIAAGSQPVGTSVLVCVCVGGVYQVLFEKKGRPMDVPIPYRREFSKVASPRSEGSLNILPFLYLVP